MHVEHDIKYRHDGDTVTFENNVRISVQQFNALNKIKGSYTRSGNSFLWSALLDLPEGESSLKVQFRPAAIKRIRYALEILESSGFFKMETAGIRKDNKDMIELHLFDIHPAILQTMALM